MKKTDIKLCIIFFLLLLIIPEIYGIVTNILKNDMYLTLTANFKNTQDLVRHGDRNKKIIAITFDDGPHPKYTPRILDLLNEYNVKATFFMLGKNVKLYPEVVKRVDYEGHEIGNHTYSHIDVKQTSERKIREEIQKTQDAIYSILNKKPKIFRPPYGFYNKKVINIVKEYGCKIILWSPNIDSKDWCNPGVKKIVKEVLTKVSNGDIILFHDYVEKDSDTVKALKIILPELKKRGYEFVTISKLIDITFSDKLSSKK